MQNKRWMKTILKVRANTIKALDLTIKLLRKQNQDSFVQELKRRVKRLDQNKLYAVEEIAICLMEDDL